VAFDAGERFESAVARALSGILLSSSFLFRAEPLDGPLDDHAIAARLSYFLWASMPDERLLGLAAAGGLADRSTRRAEAERMLDDPRAEGLFLGLFDQWLGVRGIDELPADLADFDAALRGSARAELAGFARTLLDARIEDLLLGEGGPIDDRLREHYAIDADRPIERRGLLGKAAFLAITSHSNRSSPTRRGRFVLDRLLCLPPPPPPPNVTELSENDDVGTLRERLEAHRRNPVCAGCHVAMDPIGFGLERFDRLGRSRTTDDDRPVDDSGVLFDVPFQGPVELSAILAARPELRACVAKQLTTYALGRAPTADPVLEGNTFRAMILELIDSDAFSAPPRGEP
jgi:hypothetical protein